MTLLTTDEVAKRYGFCAAHVRYLIRHKLLKAIKKGRIYLVQEKDLKHLKRLRASSAQSRKENANTL